MGQKLFWLSIAGAIGTLARYGLGTFAQRFHEPGFPWGTLLINLFGCFLFGLVWSLAEERFLISPTTRLILLVGFMGSFTTFSTYAFETAQMVENSEWLLAGLNFFLQNFLGIFGFFLGRIATRWLGF